MFDKSTNISKGFDVRVFRILFLHFDNITNSLYFSRQIFSSQESLLRMSGIDATNKIKYKFQIRIQVC